MSLRCLHEWVEEYTLSSEHIQLYCTECGAHRAEPRELADSWAPSWAEATEE